MSIRSIVEAGARHGLQVTGVVAFIAGGGLRYYYTLVAHHPRHHVISDVRNMLRTAEKLIMGSASGEPSDTIWPPGTAALLAAFQRMDPTLGVGAWLAFLQSLCVPLLIAHTTKLLFGTRSAWLALVFASLHFGFIHYGGFFLSEQFFQFAMALALWQTVAVFTYVEHLRSVAPMPAKIGRSEFVTLLLLGASVGIGWMYASTLRPTAMPTGAVVAMVSAWWAWRGKQQRVLLLLASGIVASVMALLPLADRCTRLDGEDRCLVSNNITMNMVLGQAGEVHGVIFHDPEQPERNSGWIPPALSLHGYKGTREVDFSIYDEKAALGWLVERLWEDPLAFIVRAVGNALDLFGTKYWPAHYAPATSRLATVAGQLFVALVLAPSLLAWLRMCGRLRAGISPAALVVISAPVALVLSAAMTMGEARYRTPLDGIFIALAAAWYVGGLRGVASRLQSSMRRMTFAMSAAGAVALVLLTFVILTSHPLTLVLGNENAPAGLHAVQVKGQREIEASELSVVRKRGSSWNADGNHVFACRPHCRELRINFDGPVKRSKLELSLDSNDAYQVAFYRQDELLAHVPVRQSRKDAMRIERIRVPKAAHKRFDAVGVLPLHGDGRYSVGHIRTY